MRKWFGRGFVSVNLSLIKIFYLLWSAERIFQTPSDELENSVYNVIPQTSAKSSLASEQSLMLLSSHPTIWSGITIATL